MDEDEDKRKEAFHVLFLGLWRGGGQGFFFLEGGRPRPLLGLSTVVGSCMFWDSIGGKGRGWLLFYCFLLFHREKETLEGKRKKEGKKKEKTQTKKPKQEQKEDHKRTMRGGGGGGRSTPESNTNYKPVDFGLSLPLFFAAASSSFSP